MSSSHQQQPSEATVPIGGPVPGPGQVSGERPAEPALTSQLRLGDVHLARDAAVAGNPEGAIDALPATSALLVVRGSLGARFLLDADRTTVGRKPSCDIFLDDTTVSRSHAVFERRSTDYWVQDLGSLNGTYVNGMRVEAARLDPEAQIQIGKFRMTFHPSPAASFAAEPGSPRPRSEAGVARRRAAPATTAPSLGGGLGGLWSGVVGGMGRLLRRLAAGGRGES